MSRLILPDRSRLDRFASALSLQEIFYRETPVQAPADSALILSPCRSKVERIAPIAADGRIADKKVLGRRRFFSLDDLSEDDASLAAYQGGCYVNLYLAPWDYHFVIFPVAGRITAAFRRDGFNWPVVAWGGAWLRNTRLVSVIETRFGFPMALMMVASWNVGGIEPLFELDREYERADRFGRFRIGSTVILLFPPGAVEVLCYEGQKLELGAPLARTARL
ncbi:MAG TPA: phosphatidylserine decarboxylase [Firmicutes bacterium]|nr:phosphatidylserine decarboxylase [Bacillota bacterium]